ncbi:MAG: branched-chain amino acid ABC transporter permease [Actinobacteria bacterium]|nr:branched-chain amino acid ABC transporter permease [Actinomycetota bacterium]
MRGRPELFTSYASDQAALNTPTKRTATGIFLLLLAFAPAVLSTELESLVTWAFVAAIGSIGLNIVTGYAGQVSLGHAFFIGLGAYTAAVFGGEGSANIIGFDLDMWIWLPLAGLVPAIVGLLVGPVATRLRGLYLAIVTLGLVFIGEHFFRELRDVTGGPGVGRRAAPVEIGGFRFDRTGSVFGIELDGRVKLYLFCLLLLIVMAVLAKNLVRSKVGRAFAAVRDRDIAAEIMGVPLTRYKVIAFAISSFYAGIAGALLAVTAQAGFIVPESYNLILSVQYLAMILIGGIATISGSLLGAAFVILLPRLVQELPRFVPFIEGQSTGGFLTTFQVQAILFGVLIVVFLIAEPRGLYGLWVRARNYFRAWPFSY